MGKSLSEMTDKQLSRKLVKAKERYRQVTHYQDVFCVKKDGKTMWYDTVAMSSFYKARVAILEIYEEIAKRSNDEVLMRKVHNGEWEDMLG